MIARWLIRYGWHPFEILARRTPLWPFTAKLEEPVPGVVCVRIDNAVTRLLSRFAGGYEYSVSYVINDAVMIDTGYSWAARELRQLLIEKNWSRSLEVVINTHYHEDHVGNNDVIAEMTSARFFASASTRAYLHLPPRLAWYRRFLFGPLPATRFEIAPEQIVARGMKLSLLDTPGHCPGHLCIFMPETGWLFSGDLFIAPDLDTQLPDVDGPAWIQSLERVLDLSPSALFDAHGAVVIGAEGVREMLTKKLSFLRDIEQRVQKHVYQARSIEELTARVFDGQTWRERLALGDGWMSVLTSSEFSRDHLIASFARPLLKTYYNGKTVVKLPGNLPDLPFFARAIFGQRALYHFDASDYVRWAEEMLEHGYDSYSLRILAGFKRLANIFETEDYFFSTVGELGWNIPDRDTAIREYACGIARYIVEGKISTIEGVRALERICVACDYRDYTIWSDLDEALDRLHAGDYPFTYSMDSSLSLENFDQLVIQEAEKLIAESDVSDSAADVQS